jgi:hypothetical protein
LCTTTSTIAATWRKKERKKENFEVDMGRGLIEALLREVPSGAGRSDPVV